MRRLAILMLTLAVAAPTVAVAGWEPRLAPQSAERSDLYRDGQRALDAADWEGATEIFEQLAASGGAEIDAALYWLAYAQHERGRSTAARRALETLLADHPASPWADDAQALQMEIRGAAGDPAAVTTAADDELRLYALESLMHVESERALPVLERLLAGDDSPRIKGRAMFVLSQSDSPRALEMLADVARGPEPALASKAIEYLGLYEAEQSVPLLEQIYRQAADAKVKRRIIESLMIADAEDSLARLAREEPDPALRRVAIEQLALLDAVDALDEIYATEKDPEVRRKIVEAFFLADAVERLRRIARTDPDPAIRRKAIEGIGLVGDERTSGTLRELYRSETDPEIKRKIIEAFFLSDDHEALIDLIRTETDPKLRRKALEGLSLIDSDAATDYLLELIESDGR